MRASGILRGAFERVARSQPQQLSAYSSLTGLFAVNKPAGVTSTTIVDLIQFVARRNQANPLVQRVLELDGSKRAKRGLIKVGHGGTLDPLARGVVVIGIGAGCKRLHSMNGSSKVYIAECRLGFSSTTLDSTGSLVAQGKTDHITKDSVIRALNTFKGEISQTPPLYSALSMDGKRLYDYAREGLALPREIPSRKVQIYELELLSFPDDHFTTDPSLEHYGFRVGQKDAIPDQGPLTPFSFSFLDGFHAKRMTDTPESNPDHVPIPSTPKGLVFHLRVHCSSGTYIRTLIADIAAHLGTVGHMTDLLRVEQSVFKLGGEATLEIEECVNVEALSHAVQAGNRLLEESSPPNLLNDGCSIE
ncbi:MAG: pseudouridine synthase [Benniella sp.]|nr:MAG: pseudouridine synthase [Benniella sp.]